ncbi:MAG TPA: multicopper oxidase domain-containing protein [Candidatus Binatia bacterium]|nr:multicopper oxidase domain-containing protein [Candidatus Binatia bacterium]
MTDDTLPRSLDSDVTRRGFLRGAVIAGGGLAAATLAACTPGSAGSSPAWTYPAPPVGQSPTPSGSPAATPGATAGSSMDHSSPGPSGPAASPGMDEHDQNALAVVQRFLDGEGASLPNPGNQPLEPTRIEGDTKIYEMTIDMIKHKIDAQKPEVDALGFNGTWPGPRIDVIEGDNVRVIFKNNMDESTGIHFHGQRLPNNMDGVPHVTQEPIMPGETFTYEFRARTTGSHMYHSHHNATDQVGRGLLGAFIVHPRDEAQRVEQKYGVTQDVVWISNDTLGGFTINGRGFPATSPIVANLGERILIRFMNEGVMMHPWHIHGMPMRIVARDGYELGPAAFTCDTLGVNPGERYDAVIDCDEPGAWAFHCHILPHAEGRDGMFGMVTALIVQPPAGRPAAATGTSPIVAAARAAGSTAQLICRI